MNTPLTKLNQEEAKRSTPEFPGNIDPQKRKCPFKADIN